MMTEAYKSLDGSVGLLERQGSKCILQEEAHRNQVISDAIIEQLNKSAAQIKAETGW